MLRLSLILALALTASVAQATPQVQVVGLFPNAAVLIVDGQRKFVRAGEEGPGGVQVVRADSRQAVLRIDGVEQTFALSREYNSGGYAAPTAPQEISIARGAGGHYWVAGSINNQPAQFLVDTGATTVAMNEGQARRLGLDYRVNGKPMVASTASGTVNGWRVSLDNVKIGGIEVLGVDASVLEGGFPTEILLGMSFMNRVGWREEQNMMVLQAKH